METCLSCKLVAGDEEHEKESECELRTQPELLKDHSGAFTSNHTYLTSQLITVLLFF